MRTRLSLASVRILLVIAILAVAVVAVAATNVPDVIGDQGVKVAQYVDPRFGFTLEYPVGWEVAPRDDTPGYVGGCVAIEEPSPVVVAQERVSRRRVEIGLLLVERDPSVLLAEWAVRYEKAYFFGESRVLKREEITVDGRAALLTQSRVPEGDVTYVYATDGRLVWYVWTNALSEVGTDAYGQIIRTLRFGRAMAQTLVEAYGSWFTPMPLDGWNKVPPTSGNKSLRTSMTDYIVPVDVFAGIACGDDTWSECGGTHSGSQLYSIDIGVTLESVYTPIWCWFYSSGWTAGAGWYVNVLDAYNGWVSHNYHLASIDWNSMNPYLDPWSQMPRHLRIGTSGRSAEEEIDYHLHFHVATTSASAVQLTGMYGLTLYGTYPDCDRPVGDCGTDYSCTCGYVN